MKARPEQETAMIEFPWNISHRWYNIQIVFVRLRNCRNLLFMDISPLSSYMEMPVYLLHSDYFGYVKLDAEETATLPADYKQMNFIDLKEYEFFSMSEDITKALNAARDEIRNRYVNS